MRSLANKVKAIERAARTFEEQNERDIKEVKSMIISSLQRVRSGTASEIDNVILMGAIEILETRNKELNFGPAQPVTEP